MRVTASSPAARPSPTLRLIGLYENALLTPGRTPAAIRRRPPAQTLTADDRGVLLPARDDEDLALEAERVQRAPGGHAQSVRLTLPSMATPGEVGAEGVSSSPAGAGGLGGGMALAPARQSSGPAMTLGAAASELEHLNPEHPARGGGPLRGELRPACAARPPAPGARRAGAGAGDQRLRGRHSARLLAPGALRALLPRGASVSRPSIKTGVRSGDGGPAAPTTHRPRGASLYALGLTLEAQKWGGYGGGGRGGVGSLLQRRRRSPAVNPCGSYESSPVACPRSLGPCAMASRAKVRRPGGSTTLLSIRAGRPDGRRGGAFDDEAPVSCLPGSRRGLVFFLGLAIPPGGRNGATRHGHRPGSRTSSSRPRSSCRTTTGSTPVSPSRLEGGAYIARLANAPALFYNPAGIATVERTVLNASAQGYEATVVLRLWLLPPLAGLELHHHPQLPWPGVRARRSSTGTPSGMGFSISNPVSWDQTVVAATRPGKASGSPTPPTRTSRRSSPVSPSAGRRPPALRFGGRSSSPHHLSRYRARSPASMTTATTSQGALATIAGNGSTLQVRGVGSVSGRPTTGWSWAPSSGPGVEHPQERRADPYESLSSLNVGSRQIIFQDTSAEFQYLTPWEVGRGNRFDWGVIGFEVDLRYHSGTHTYTLLGSTKPGQRVDTTSGLPVTTDVCLQRDEIPRARRLERGASGSASSC